MNPRPGRQAILEQMVADGMRYLFGNPGTVEQGFLDALRDVPEVHYILGLQETVPVAIADGYARATRKAAMVQLHSGVGLGNGIGMVYQAKRGHAPLVVIAGESGMAYDAMDAQMACDLVALAKPVTKWAARVVDPSSLLRVLRRAVKIASTPPMGPTFLALPMDVLDLPNREDVVPTSIPRTATAPAAETVRGLANLLAGARAPVLIIGDGVAFSEAQAPLARVAELLGAAVWGADSSEVNMDARHPLFRGLLGHMFGSSSKPHLAAADAVLIIGTYVLPEVFPLLENIFAPGAKVAHIDLDGYEIAKNFPVDLGLVADPALTLTALAAALEAVLTPAQREAAAGRARALTALKERELAQALEEDERSAGSLPLQPAVFMKELAARLQGEAVIFDEALTCSPALNRYLPASSPGRFFQTRGGSLGVGIPGAIGLKLAHPEKTVVGFTGDGGSMYTIQALWTAAHHRVGAKFVICNNHSYRLLKLNIQQYWRERAIPDHAFPASFDLREPDIDFVGLARSMGVSAVKVQRPEEIGPALDKALADDAPWLIDLVVSDEVPGHKSDCKCGQ